MVIEHILYLWQSLKIKTFFIFCEFASKIYPIKIHHSKNLIPKLASRIFLYIYFKNFFYIFRSTFRKSSNYLESTKIATFKGKTLEWITPVSRIMNSSPLFYPKTAQFYSGYPTMFSLLGHLQISMRSFCLTKKF